MPGIRFSVANSKRKGMHYHKVENPITATFGIKEVINKPLDNNLVVKEYLKGVAWFRIDILLEGQRKNNEKIGHQYKEAVKFITQKLETRQ